MGRCRGGGVLREASRRLPKVLPRSGASVAEPAGPGQLQGLKILEICLAPNSCASQRMSSQWA